MAMFKVAAHTGADNQGWIGYNEETKEITVCLQDEALKKRLMNIYLRRKH